MLATEIRVLRAPLRLSLLIAVCATACAAKFSQKPATPPDAELTILDGTNHVVIDHSFLIHRLNPVAVEVDDPVYVKRKRYSGYWLADLIKAAGLKSGAEDVWIFSALDGYQARVSATELFANDAKPFLAMRDLDSTDGWEKIRQGKEWLSPGPYYLVWKYRTSADEHTKRPWPYQLTQIRIQKADKSREKLFPKEGARTEAVSRGFEVFEKNCISCHSINLEGGGLGPELNIPKNILEYRDRRIVKEFILDPSSFRARSKMPAFKASLSDGSVEDLLNYFAWIGAHKITPN